MKSNIVSFPNKFPQDEHEITPNIGDFVICNFGAGHGGRVYIVTSRVESEWGGHWVAKSTETGEVTTINRFHDHTKTSQIGSYVMGPEYNEDLVMRF